MDAEPAKEARGSVWVVDKPGVAGRLYLSGTIHLLRAEDYPLAVGYEMAYAGSEELLFELPPGLGPEVSNRMRELGTYPGDVALPDHVDAATWAAVQAWAAKRGMSEAFVRKLRPWFVSLLITALEYSSLGAKPERGVDHHFEERAKKDRKAARGLETAEFQIELFTGLTEAQQKGFLEQTLGEISTLPAEYEKMITAWKAGDLETLQAMLFREAERYPELMDVFLTNRNRAWVKQLTEVLERGGRAMVLVGTGHLCGEEGLIELLRGLGYRIRHAAEAELSEKETRTQRRER